MEVGLGIILGASLFIFGMLIGSFLNVVILRHNTGKNLSGRSTCQSCGKRLKSLELIPIFSFLIQKGLCSSCNSKISPQYPLVEFLTGVMFLLVFFTYTTIPSILLSLIVISLLVIITVYDLKHGIIPNIFVYLFIATSIIVLFFNMSTLSVTWPSTSAFLAGPLLAIPIWLLWQISDGRWIGLGDAKLFLGVGWFLGLAKGVTVFALSFWIGAGVSLLLMFFNGFIRTKKLNLRYKDLTIKTEIPFAPFIVLSFFIVYFFGVNLVSIIAP